MMTAGGPGGRTGGGPQLNRFEHVQGVGPIWLVTDQWHHCVMVTWGPPWTDRMTDRHDWKHYLHTTLLAGGKMQNLCTSNVSPYLAGTSLIILHHVHIHTSQSLKVRQRSILNQEMKYQNKFCLTFYCSFLLCTRKYTSSCRTKSPLNCNDKNVPFLSDLYIY